MPGLACAKALEPEWEEQQQREEHLSEMFSCLFALKALLQASHPQLLVQIHWVWLCHPAQWPWRWHSISQTQFPLCKLTSNADLTGLQVASRKCWRAQGPSRSWHPVGMQLMLLGWAQSVNYGSQAWYSVTPNSFSISQLPLKQSLIICGTMGCMFVAEMGLPFFFLTFNYLFIGCAGSLLLHMGFL